MLNLPLWILKNKFPSVYDSESATAIEMTSKLYGAMQELIDEYNKFAEECNTMINEFTLSSEQDAHKFEVAMSQKFQDFIDVVELKLTSYENGRDEFTNTANSLLETLRQANESFKEDLTGEFNTHKSAVDQRLQEYERDTEVAWEEIVNKPFDAETVTGTLRQIYSGSPEFTGTKGTITPIEPLKFNTGYSVYVACYQQLDPQQSTQDWVFNCKIGGANILGKPTYTMSQGGVNLFRMTGDGKNIVFESLTGLIPIDIRITVTEETTVTKQLDPMFIPKEINVPWVYITDKPFGHSVQNAIYWDGASNVAFYADTDMGFTHVSDLVCGYEDILAGGGVHNSGNWANGSYVDIPFTPDDVVKVTDDLFYIRKAGCDVFVCLKDNFTMSYDEFYTFWTNPSGAKTGTLTIPKKGIYMNGSSLTLYPDTFYINDYKFESYEPLPDELLGEVPEQIAGLTERVTELEENGGTADMSQYFETVDGDTLVWDGNTEDKYFLSEASCHVSNFAPPLDELKKGGFFTFSLGSTSENVPFTSDDIMSADEMGFGSGLTLVTENGNPYIIIVHTPNATASLDGMALPTNVPVGTYFYYGANDDYVKSITINAYTGFTKEVIKEEYLPTVKMKLFTDTMELFEWLKVNANKFVRANVIIGDKHITLTGCERTYDGDEVVYVSMSACLIRGIYADHCRTVNVILGLDSTNVKYQQCAVNNYNGTQPQYTKEDDTILPHSYAAAMGATATVLYVD